MLLSCGAMSEVNMIAPRSPGNWLKYCLVKVLMTTNSTLPRIESTAGQPLHGGKSDDAFTLALRKCRKLYLGTSTCHDASAMTLSISFPLVQVSSCMTTSAAQLLPRCGPLNRTTACTRLLIDGLLQGDSAHLPPLSISASFREDALPRSWSGVMMSVASNTERISLCSSVTSASVMPRTLMNLRNNTGVRCAICWSHTRVPRLDTTLLSGCTGVVISFGAARSKNAWS